MIDSRIPKSGKPFKNNKIEPYYKQEISLNIDYFFEKPIPINNLSVNEFSPNDETSKSEKIR